MGDEVDIKELENVGKRLTDPPSSKDSLCKLLKQALLLLSSVSQSPLESTISAMQLSVQALVKPNLLKHKDKDVRLLVATCISEVMRIVAPEAPYDDEILKDVFELIVASFKGLNETSSSHYERRVNILEAVATYKSCLVMLDLDCDHLIQEMFQSFFLTVSEVSKSVMECMKTILCLVLNESEEIPEHLLELLLGNLLRQKKDVSRAGCRLARAVVRECSEKLRPYVEAFLNSNIFKEKSLTNRWSESYSDLIYEIYTCAPSLLVPTLSKLMDELLTDEVDVRLKAVTLLGRMFASQQGVSNVAEVIYVEYLKRFTDKAVEVRLAMVKCAKEFLFANPSGPKSEDFLSALSDRLQDFETEARLHAVLAICDVAQSNPQLTLVNELKRVAERLRDTEVTVRQETQQRLMDLYKSFCSKRVEGLPVSTDTFYWIPSKLIRSSCDKDSKEFREQGMELVSEQLFPIGFPVKEIVKCWIQFFGDFDDYDRKAFHYILLQKQRLHSDMRSILSLRQKLKDEESPEVEARILALCKSLSNVFADSSNAETLLRKLTQLKDMKLFKDLADLLDPNTSIAQSASIREFLLKRLGEKHPLYGFLKVLSLKCSYALFGKEHMHILLTELKELRSLEDENLLKASMALLVDFTNHFPTLLDGVEDDVMVLLSKDADFVKDGAVQVLAKVGGSMRGRIPEGSKSVNVLGDLCVKGSRKQAKYAVQALSAMSNDAGLMVFSGLYRKLLDLLESSINLPTILQSLGCIAQHAMSVFEANEEDLVNFLVKDLFRRDSVPSNFDDDDHPVGEITGLKIFGIKTLVRSFLPNKDSQQVQRLKGLFKILLKFLESGEIADDIKSSDTDKAHLRLAAAKGVLRLSKRYDAQISPQLFKATVSCAKDCSVFVKRQFLSKVGKLLKERHIPHRYACGLAISIGVSEDDLLQEAQQQLSDFVESSHRQARHKEPFGVGLLDTSPLICYPEYVLFHLVHVLAHQANFGTIIEGGPSSKAVELYLKQLYLFLWVLLNHSSESIINKEDRHEAPNNVSLIYGIFSAMKNAEDVVDASKTESTYILCDIGIAILKKLTGIEQLNVKDVPNIPFPKLIYESSNDTAKSKNKIDGSYLPKFIVNDDYFSHLLPLGTDLGVKTQKRKIEEDESASLEKEERPVKKQSKVAVSPAKKRTKQILVSKSLVGKVQDGGKLPSELSDDGRRAQPMERSKSYHDDSTDMESPETVNVNANSPKKRRNTAKEDEPIQKQEKITISAGKKRTPTHKEKLARKSSYFDEQRDFKRFPEHPRGNKAMGHTSIETKKYVNAEMMESPGKINANVMFPKQKTDQPKDGEDETLLSELQKQKRLKNKVDIDKVVKDETRLPSLQIVIHDKEVTAFEAVDSPRKRVRISIKEPKRPQQAPVDRNDLSARRNHGKKVLGNILSEASDNAHRDKKVVDSSNYEVNDNVRAQVQGSKYSGTPPKKSAKNKIPKEKKGEAFGKELLNKKVQVYWPIDKRFYRGTIRAYNATKKLHDVIYDDGDKETLDLRKERWELLEEEEEKELCLEELASAAKFSKNSSQLKVNKEGLEKKSNSKETSISSGSFKKSKPDASSLFSKIAQKRMKSIEEIQGGESLGKVNKVLDGKDASPIVQKQKLKTRMSLEKKASSAGSKGISLNDQTAKGITSFDEPQDPDDDAPLNAWKPFRKKGQ